MNKLQLELLLQLTAPVYLGILAAGASMPKAVQLASHLRILPPFIHRLVWVYFTFLAGTIAAFGVLTFVFAKQMADGDPLGRALALVLLLFWTARTLVAAFVFDLRPYLTHTWKKVGYQLTNIAFLYLILVYTLVVIKGGLA